MKMSYTFLTNLNDNVLFLDNVFFFGQHVPFETERVLIIHITYSLAYELVMYIPHHPVTCMSCYLTYHNVSYTFYNNLDVHNVFQ